MNRKNGRTRVVITGMGTINPLGKNLDEYWDGLIEGRSTARTVEGTYPTDKLTTKFACEIQGYDPTTYLDRKAASRMSRFAQMAVIASNMALEDAALDVSKEESFRVGVDLGTGIGGFIEMTSGAGAFAMKGRLSNPLYAAVILPNMAAASVAMHFRVRGPNTTMTTACAASTHAIGDAARIIEHGDADVMLAGGTEAGLCEIGIYAFGVIKALSTRNDAPEKASRPFDRDRDGFVPGEGAGVLVLESLEHAVNRGARIYGEVLGFGLTCDAYHQVAPDATGEAPAQAVTLAMKDAGVEPADIDYINAHGTSTPLGDLAETVALKRCFGDHARKLAVSSTKSMTGHLLGAAGGVEAIFSVLAIRDQVAPPTANLFNQDPACDLDYVPNAARRMPLRSALSNSFGFGGTNGTLIFKRI